MAGDLLETISQMFEPGGRLAICAVILVGIAAYQRGRSGDLDRPDLSLPIVR
jgi:hypothetical protein